MTRPAKVLGIPGRPNFSPAPTRWSNEVAAVHEFVPGHKADIWGKPDISRYSTLSLHPTGSARSANGRPAHDAKRRPGPA